MSSLAQVLPSSGGGGMGTVTSISQANGIVLTPNPITATGTVAVADAVAMAFTTDDTNIAVPVSNDLVLQGANGVTTSSSGNTVVINGPTIPSSAFVLLQTQSPTPSSTVTSLVFNTGFSTAYTNYFLIFSQVKLETANNVSLMIQISENGGSSYATTGYVDSNSITNGATITTTGNGTNSFYTASGWAYICGFTTLPNALLYTLPGINGNYTLVNSTLGSITSTATYALCGPGGSFPGRINYNAFQILMEDGSAFSGQFSLYGLSL